VSFRNQPRLEDFPALGFIPCPGDQESMDSVDQTFSDTADVLNEVLAVLTGADEGEWRGETVHAFREMLEHDFRPKVEDACQSFGDAHRAICDWLVDMEDFQARAAAMEQEAAAARDQVQAAQAAVDGLPPESEESGDDQERAEGDKTPEETRERLEWDLTTADDALEDVRERARNLQDEYNEAGRDIAYRLRDAMDLAPNEPGWLSSAIDGFSGWMDSLGDIIDGIGAGLVDVLAEWALVLRNIAAVAGVLATIAGVASMLPIPFAQTLAGAALTFAAISMVANYGAAVGETGSFTSALTDIEFMMSAAGLVFGGASFAGMRTLSNMSVAGSRVADDVFGFAVRSSSVLPGAMPHVDNLIYMTNGATGSGLLADAMGLGTTEWVDLFDSDNWTPSDSPVPTDD
jgi:hypothetical protein